MTNSEPPDVGTNPEQLREIIVRAATPFIAEWDTVTAAQIARAAGIDESALLVAFADAQAVLTAALQALVMTALDPTQVVQDLRAVALDQPLAMRLAEAISALDTYHQRMVTVLAPLETPTTERSQSTPDVRTAGEPRSRQISHEDLRSAARMDVIGDAVTTLLEPDQDHLRLPAGTLADAFIGLYSGRKRAPLQGHAQPPAEQLIDLFLHGALTSADATRRPSPAAQSRP